MGIPSQRLRGFVAQGMDGRKASKQAYSYSYPPGTYSWTCPASGVWRFVLWGAGASSNNNNGWAGGSGAFYYAERFVGAGQVVNLVVGRGGAVVLTGANGANTTATLPNAEVLTAGGGITVASSTGGAVTANRPTDIVFAGSPGATDGLGTAGGLKGTGSGGGSGAPGYGTYRGGAGANQLDQRSGGAPGAGGCVTGDDGSGGGDGLAILTRIS